MDTSLSRGTGLRRNRQPNGSSRVLYSDLHASAMPTMVNDWVRHFTRSSSMSGLNRRYAVLHCNWNSLRANVTMSLIQVGCVTCDNASNNMTMMQELGRRMDLAYRKQKVTKTYDWRKRKIKCVYTVVVPFSADVPAQLPGARHQSRNSGPHRHIQQIPPLRS